MKFPYQPHPQVLHYIPDFTQPALTLGTNHCQLRPHNPKKNPLAVTYKKESIPLDAASAFSVPIVLPYRIKSSLNLLYHFH